MDQCVTKAILILTLALSCFSAAPTNSSPTTANGTDHERCLIDFNDLLHFIMHTLVSEESFQPFEKMENHQRASFDRIQTSQDSSVESSSESLDDGMSKRIYKLLERLETVIRNFNHTISSISCIGHNQPKGKAVSNVAELQQSMQLACKDSPLMCFVFRLLHWMYVEPTYEIVQLLRCWIKMRSFNCD